MYRDMKKAALTLMGLWSLLALLHISSSYARADTGHEGAQRKEIGSYLGVRRVTGSSVAGTEFFAASIKRPDGSCLNNTATTVWIGTVSATQHLTLHSNIVNGYPVTSTQPWKLDGSFTGNMYFTCSEGIATCEFRCADGLVQ